MRRLATLSIYCLLTGIAVAAQGWPQWGGPHRNFMADSAGLADTWPANGPKRLWSRELGDGHSSIVVDGDRLFTMYARGEQEYAIALDRASGKTLWEKSYAAPTAGLTLQVDAFNVRGPHATPLVAGDLLITIGIIGNMQAFEKQTGKVVWSHDIWREFGGTRLERGFVCSPLAYKNLLIVTVGGTGQALMAFDQKTGAVVWKAQNFRLSPSSPVLINVDGLRGGRSEYRRAALAAHAQMWRLQHHAGSLGIGQYSFHLISV